MSRIYYDHDDEVRFTEGCLNKSEDWEWFVELTESHPEPNTHLSCFADFGAVFAQASDVYDHFCRLCVLGLDANLRFSHDWTQRIMRAARIWHGDTMLVPGQSSDTLLDVLDIIAYGTHLMNELSDNTYVYRTDFCTYRNLGELYPFDALGDKGERLLDALDALVIYGADFAHAAAADNIACKTVQCNETLVQDFLDAHFDPDFLSFREFDGSQCSTWEERYLFEMPMTKIISGKLVPAISLGGSSRPDFALWSSEALGVMESALNEPRAKCIIESIDFLLHQKKPSDETIQIIGSLAADRVASVAEGLLPISGLHCTAVELACLLRTVIERRNDAMSQLMTDICKAYGSTTDASALNEIGQLGFPLSKTQQEIVHAAIVASIESLMGIGSPYELRAFFDNARARKYCTHQQAEEALEKLKDMASSGTVTGVALADLYQSALGFLIALLGNPAVENDWIKSRMIQLKDNWTSSYYHNVSSSMQVLTASTALDSSVVESFNNLILHSPYDAAAQMMPLDEQHLSDMFVAIGDAPLFSVVNTIEIEEFFPRAPRIVHDKSHPIDQMLFEMLDNVNNSFAYRQLNHFETEDVLLQAYSSLHTGIQFGIALLGDAKQLYKEVVRMSPSQYRLLEYPEDGVHLGHITQLFPLLENTIRDIGAHFLVVPFQLKDRTYHVSKDVVSVLKEILDQVFKTSRTLEGANDFVLTYHVMYNSNGFNIRNSCIHGRDYLQGNRLEFAFRATVFCIYSMLWRLERLREAQGEE